MPGLLSSRSFQGGEEPIIIYGPAGLENYVRTSLQVTKTHLAYPLEFVELKEGVIFKDKQFTVECMLLDHGIESFGFRVTEADHEGMLQVDKLAELGIPAGPIYGKLKQGQTVTLADGRTINGKDFVGESKHGRVVTIFGDTRFTARSSEFAKTVMWLFTRAPLIKMKQNWHVRISIQQRSRQHQLRKKQRQENLC